jgi:hypothetical protein
MGSDLIVESTTQPELYRQCGEEFLPEAWKDIRWEEVLELCHINLYLLYDNAICYWSVDQVARMYEILKEMYENPEEMFNFVDGAGEPSIKKAKILKDDTYKLMKCFENYVQNKAIIYVF